MTRRIFTPVFALCLAAAAGGQDEGGGQGMPFFEAVDVNVVNVEVFVTDKRDQPVTGLEASDFELFEDGRPVEITNFYAVGDSGSTAPPSIVERAEARLGAPGGVPGDTPMSDAPVAVPIDQRLHLILYFDNLFLEPFGRSRVIREVRSFLHDNVGAEDRVMVVTFERSLHLRQPFTDDLRAVYDALEEIETMNAFGIQDRAERDRVLRMVTESNSYLDAEPVVSGYADAAFNDLGRSIEGLRELVEPLAGLPGRKAILYVSDGIPMVVGADLFQFLDRRFRESRQGNLMSLRYSARNKFRHLVDSANANRVTFYTIEASGLQSHSSLSAASRIGDSGSMMEVDMENDLNREEPLLMVAADTGGLAALNTNNLAGAFERMGTDLRSYYSLGYSPAHFGAGRSHRIEVKVKGRGLKVRHRTSYRDKSFEARLIDSVLAALRFGAEANTLDLRIETARARNDQADQFLVPIKVTVPFSNVTLVPREGVFHGRLQLVLAVIDEDGDTSTPEATALPLSVPAAAIDQVLEQDVVYGAELRMRPGRHQIAVGLRDEISGQTAVVSRTFSVGD